MDADGVCYTYETLASLHEECPDDRFYFIMGADSLSEFESWRNPDIICQNAVILAAVRDLTDDGALAGSDPASDRKISGRDLSYTDA